MESNSLPLSGLALRQAYPEIDNWEAVRARIRARGKDLADPEKHDATDQANWRDINTIFCPALAMAVYYMPKQYPLWPAYWHDYVMRLYDMGINVIMRGPRRRAKSAGARAHQLKRMLTLQAAFTTHICLTPQLVLEHSSAVIHEFETNARLQEAFHIHPGTIQRQEHFQIQVGTSHRTTLKFEWMTRDGEARGTGRNLVLVDDPDTDTDSPYIQEKYYGKFHASALGTLEPFEGVPPQIILSCNLTGPHCNGILFEKRDAKSDPGAWVAVTVPAIEEGETQHITKTEVGESTWPDRFSTKETKDQIRAMNMSKMRSGTMEMQNKITDTSRIIWVEEMFKLHYNPLAVQPHQLESRVYVDSAQAENEAGDDWAIWRMSKVIDGEHKGEVWLEAVNFDSMDPDSAINAALDMCIGNGSARMPQCVKIRGESKTKKGMDPWLNDLQKTARRDRGMFISVEMMVPVMGKRGRALAVQSLGLARAIRTPEIWDDMMTKGIDQICAFTGDEGKHLAAIDDAHDAFVWGLTDLQYVDSKSAHLAAMHQAVPVKGRLRAVA